MTYAQAKLTCHPSMKDLCSDSHSALIGGSWVIVAPETITMVISFFQIGSFRVNDEVLSGR
jgi:hypothetical protein